MAMTDHTYAGHTAEPWTVWTSNSRIRISTTGRHARDGAVVDVASDSRGRPVLLIRPEDARRIVACVNALAGWKTETIERYATDGAPGRPNLGQAFHELKQRAERAEMWQHVETSRADELQENVYYDRDEIAGLRARIAELEADSSEYEAFVNECRAMSPGDDVPLHGLADRMRADKRALRIDAERYRWIRDKERFHVDGECGDAAFSSCMCCAEEFDDAIDAARAQPAE